MEEAVATPRKRVRPTNVKDPLKWLYRGLALWMIVTYFRPQDMFRPLMAIPLGYIASIILVVAWFQHRNVEIPKRRISVLHILMLVVVCLGVFKAVNTYWLFQSFVTLATFWVVFFLCMPLVIESAQYRPKLLRVLFTCFAAIGLWTCTHGGHGQGAFLGDENDAALALVVGFGLCFTLRKELTGRFDSIFTFVVMSLCVAGVIASMSRGGFLGLVAVLFAAAYFSGRVMKTLGTMILLALLALPFVPKKYFAEINTISDTNESTAVMRMHMWRIAVEEYLSNPVLGVGAGNYAYRVADYENAEWVQKANKSYKRSFGGRSVHSSHFQLLSELGTLGTVVFILMVTFVLRQAMTIGRTKESQSLSVRLAQATGAAMIAFLAAGTFLSALYYPHFWLICALAGSVVPLARAEQSLVPQAEVAPDEHRRRRRMTAGGKAVAQRTSR